MTKWVKFKLKDFNQTAAGKPFLYGSFDTPQLRVPGLKTQLFFNHKILDKESLIVPEEEIERIEKEGKYKAKFPTPVNEGVDMKTKKYRFVSAPSSKVLKDERESEDKQPMEAVACETGAVEAPKFSIRRDLLRKRENEKV